MVAAAALLLVGGLASTVRNSRFELMTLAGGKE
jgi:hypothetical protein